MKRPQVVALSALLLAIAACDRRELTGEKWAPTGPITFRDIDFTHGIVRTKKSSGLEITLGPDVSCDGDDGDLARRFTYQAPSGPGDSFFVGSPFTVTAFHTKQGSLEITTRLDAFELRPDATVRGAIRIESRTVGKEAKSEGRFEAKICPGIDPAIAKRGDPSVASIKDTLKVTVSNQVRPLTKVLMRTSFGGWMIRIDAAGATCDATWPQRDDTDHVEITFRSVDVHRKGHVVPAMGAWVPQEGLFAETGASHGWISFDDNFPPIGKKTSGRMHVVLTPTKSWSGVVSGRFDAEVCPNPPPK